MEQETAQKETSEPQTVETEVQTPISGQESSGTQEKEKEPEPAGTSPSRETPQPSEQVSDGRSRRRKRTRFLVPDWKPRPVKALWESATDDDRERAHQTAMVILEYWTAQLSKPEAAERLGVAPIRVWQLSQQAVSGMLAGLLTQPRDRGKQGESSEDGEERKTARERALEKEVSKLEERLAASHRLIEVMRELPVVRASKEPTLQSARKKGGKRSGKPNPRRSKKPAGEGPGSTRHAQ